MLPTSYQITVKNSTYYRGCSLLTSGSEKCQLIDPPIIIKKRKPYISAWWEKTRIAQLFTKEEVSTEWIHN